MSRTIELIPRVKVGGLRIRNLATGEESFTSIDNLFEEGETISITYVPQAQNFKDAIRQQLREEIIIRLDAARSEGIGLFKAELEGSPPVVVIIPDGTAEFVDANYGEWGGIEAKYFVVRTGGGQVANPTNDAFTLLDRIFLSAPPSIKYDTCEYFEPDNNNLLNLDWNGKEREASCGFQYFYQTFHTQKDYKKFVKMAEKKEQKLPDGTKAKGSFEKIKWYCENDPPQYEEWLFLYKDWMKKKNLDNCIVKPVEEDIVKKLSSMDEIEVIDLKPPDYSEFEKYNSMNIDNIVKLCMWMKLNLMVFDEFGDLMLVYDKNNEYHNNKKTKGGRVVIKVSDNHGYFVKKSDPLLLSCSRGGKHGWDGFYPTEQITEVNNFAKDEAQVKEIEADTPEILKHPKALFKQKDIEYDWECLREIEGEPTQEDFENIKAQQEAPYLRDIPPPTPQELIGMMDTGAIYYVGNTNLNGIVNYLQKNTTITSSIQVGEKQGYWKIVKPEIKEGLKPRFLRGLPTAIHKATYGKLKLYAYHQHPTTGYKYPEDLDGGLVGDEDRQELEKECLDKWKEDYPELKKYAIPTPSTMGKAIFDSLKLDCYSRMNTSVKKIFFEAETKPDFRANKPTHDWACAFSLDFSKAYSNAAKFMDCEWSVFDAVDDPKLFRSDFDENAFYLVEELETGFPYKDLKGRGLALYHGCLLRHLRDKVVIKFIINSHKKLPKDYFVEFVNKCYEIAGDGRDNVVSAKQLVNTTFGALKNKGGIKDYKLSINSDIIQLNMSFAEGNPVHNLEKGKRWRGSSFITAKGDYKHHFLSGQPIRLQIMDRINELNLLLDSAVRTSLNRDIHLLLVKTDALYYQYPNNCKYCMKDYYWNNFDFDPRKEVNVEEINSKLPEGYEVKLEHPREDWGKPVEVKDSWTTAPDKLNQQPIPKFGRIWRRPDVKDEWWDKSEVKDIFYKYYQLGGLYCRGEGGVGKTEIIKGIDEICRINRVKLETMKIVLKNLDNKELIIKEWRETHPCFVYKLAPTNKACNNIGGKTLHRGLGLRVCKDIDCESDSDSDSDDEEYKDDNSDRVERLIKRFENKPPDVMPVDEISMIGGEGWSVLSYIKYRIPSIKFFLFGDIKRQLPPVGEERRKFDDTICMKELANYNKLELKYNFRRGTADTNTLWELCSNKPEVFKITNSPLTYRNLCWTNETRKEVIDKIQNIHPNPVLWIDCGKRKDPNNTGQNEKLMLAIGTPLIARKSMKVREVAKNEIWKVKSIGEEIVLQYKDREESFTQEEIRKKWLSAYCITIHKSQGDTYRDEYTIWDWDRISKNKDLQSKKLRYTAVSRSVNYEELVKFK